MSGHETSIFLPRWAALDDAALLAHFRGPRPVRYYPVADPDETRADKIDALLAGRFEFNGETHRLADPVDWLHNPSADVEWHILLHKFYYAVGLGLAFERSGDARYVKCWASLIDTWMRTTPPGFIAADVTGRRVQNWIYSLHLFVGHAARDTQPHITPAFYTRLLHSLHEQVEFLCANLTEKRNHRTLELYAIFLAGVVLPEMKRASRWREFALHETVANLAADLLPDGVHCELSTDYHHLVLKNALNFRRLAGLNGVAVPASFDAAVQRGLEFSLHVHKPDGIVPSLSDGDARSHRDLLRQGAELFGRADMLYVATQGAQGSPPSARVAHFPVSGYSVLRSDWGDGDTPFADAQYLVFDSGPLGEGNHGHFDCLSFELAAFGRSLVVDPGRYTYSEAVHPDDGVNWRVRFRGTAVHNTVCVDGLQQTRYAPKPIKPGTRHAVGSVRHKIGGPAPDASLVECHHGAAFDLLHGRARSHEYDALHDRCIVFIDRRYWIVSDWLRADTPHAYRLNFQLGEHAQGRTFLSTGAGVRASSPGLLVLQPERAGVSTALQPSWVSARYGDKQPAPALQSQQLARDAEFDTVLLPWRGVEPRVTVDDVLADATPDAAHQASPRALRITFGDGDDRVVDHWFHAHDAGPRHWRIGGFEFSGRWAFWREDAHGKVLRVVTDSTVSAAALSDDKPAAQSSAAGLREVMA
jgi:hypothetical protein